MCPLPDNKWIDEKLAKYKQIKCQSQVFLYKFCEMVGVKKHGTKTIINHELIAAAVAVSTVNVVMGIITIIIIITLITSFIFSIDIVIFIPIIPIIIIVAPSASPSL